MIEETLQEIGLTKNEATIYNVLIGMGPSTVSEISKQAKLHRSNTYDAVARLLQMGIISFFTKEKAKYFQATDPENLVNILEQKKAALNAILPQLLTSYKYSKTKSDILVFEGIVAMRNILLDALNHTNSIRVMGIPKIAAELLSAPFLEKFHRLRVERKIQFNHLVNPDYAPERVKLLKEMKYTGITVLPGRFSSLVSTNIFDDEVVLSLWINPIISIKIRNKEIAESYANFFDLMWNQHK